MNNGKRIALVVDDSMLIRHSVCRFFEEHGFAVESAINGLDALDVLRTVNPDIIVTDLSMPKMTGSEFISALKRSERFQRTPLVVLAARRSTTELHPETRADHVIYKDIDIEEQLERMLRQTFTT